MMQYLNYVDLLNDLGYWSLMKSLCGLFDFTAVLSELRARTAVIVEHGSY